jgi:hypothetical protein
MGAVACWGVAPTKAGAQLAIAGDGERVIFHKWIDFTAVGEIDQRLATVVPTPLASIEQRMRWTNATDAAWLGVVARRAPFDNRVLTRPLLQGGVARVFHAFDVSLSTTAYAVRIPGPEPRTSAWYGSPIANSTAQATPVGATGEIVEIPPTDTVSPTGSVTHVRSWSDVEGRVLLPLAVASLELAVGARPRVDSTRGQHWATITGRFPVTAAISFDATIGTRPDVFMLGSPRRFAELAAHVIPRRTTERARAGESFPFTMRPIDGRRYRVSYARATAASVEISGDFSGWRPVSLLESTPGVWQAVLELSPGLHHMNLRVDGGSWLAPPGVPTVRDEFGGSVGVLIVR